MYILRRPAERLKIRYHFLSRSTQNNILRGTQRQRKNYAWNLIQTNCANTVYFDSSGGFIMYMR